MRIDESFLQIVPQVPCDQRAGYIRKFGVIKSDNWKRILSGGKFDASSRGISSGLAGASTRAGLQPDTANPWRRPHLQARPFRSHVQVPRPDREPRSPDFELGGRSFRPAAARKSPAVAA